MTVDIKFKGTNITYSYENVRKVEIMPKDSIRGEIDDVSYEETADLILRIKLEDDEQATFSMDEDFEYTVHQGGRNYVQNSIS